MAFKHVLLGLLARGPQHGYDLKSAYENELAPQSRLNSGQVYATLDRMGGEGLVEFERVSQDDRPDKKVYRLTEPGRAELQEWLASPSPVDLGLRNETFMKAILSPSPGGVLARQRTLLFARLHEVADARDQAEREGLVGPQLLLDLAARRLEAEIHWLERCEGVLDGRSLKEKEA